MGDLERLVKIEQNIKELRDDVKSYEEEMRIQTKEIKRNTEISIDSNSILKSLNNNFMKLMTLLLGIIAAQLGVNFFPKSPIDWSGAMSNSIRFLSIFVLTFLSFRLVSTRGKYGKWLIFGLVGLSTNLVIFMFPESLTKDWLMFVIGLLYIVSLFVYSWKLEQIRVEE